MKNSKFIIVGATGYIGGALIKGARKLGDVVGTSSAGGEGLLAFDLAHPNEFDYANIGAGDVVFLLAAISAPDVCARDYLRAWECNVKGTVAFISAAMERGARVVFFSSDTVYGERNDDFSECAKTNPVGEYALMKSEVEKIFSGDSLFKAIRLSYVFSDQDKFTRYLIDCARRSEVADIFHPFYRAVIHRDDVISGALKLAESWEDFPDAIINFGGGANFIQDRDCGIS
jgi:nucleoside-diphosphate-sugar epimerase